MDASQRATFQQGVKAAAQRWPQIGPGDPTTSVDPNLADIYWHVQRLQNLLHIELPLVLPPKAAGVAAVELVEQHLIGGLPLRSLSADAVAEKAARLADALEQDQLLSGAPLQRYVTALYAWHGCINMAKVLRRTYVTPAGEAEYAPEQRRQGYAHLSTHWSLEEARGNPWVRYGVSLARLLEKSRKADDFAQRVVEDWVPRDSPYWEQ